MGWLLYREPERNPLPPGSIGNAEIHVIIVVDGGGKRAFFFFKSFLWHHKIKGFSNPVFFASFPEEEIVKAGP